MKQFAQIIQKRALKQQTSRVVQTEYVFQQFKKICGVEKMEGYIKNDTLVITRIDHADRIAIFLKQTLLLQQLNEKISQLSSVVIKKIRFVNK